MRITYVAKHHSGGSDDEGAISYALSALGHDVVHINEQGSSPARVVEFAGDAEFILFHKWEDVHTIRHLKIPKVFWYFDLVQCNDPTLELRCRNRIRWMNRTVPHVSLGFCTDGDWVDDDPTGKLVWLPQGADERVVGRGHFLQGAEQRAANKQTILFTGISRGGGVGRMQFVNDMRSKYGEAFHHVAGGVYRLDLANLIAAHKVTVCPDAPTTGRYWSNRIYNAAGFGACIIHPWCGELLNSQYQDEVDVRYYHNREHLHALIEHYLTSPLEARQLGDAALERTRREHLYRHRCEELIRVVRERLGVK